jgi:hypothetical protein
MSPLIALIFLPWVRSAKMAGSSLWRTERPVPWWSRSRSHVCPAVLRLTRGPHPPRHSGAAPRLAIDAIENLADRPQVAGKREIDELAGDQLRHRRGAAVGRLGLARKLHQQDFSQPAVGTTGARAHGVAHQW